MHAIDSEYFGEPRELCVCTPPEYDKHPERRYPVLYLLHGGGQNARSWFELGRANQIVDSLLSEGKACSMILVSPTVYGRMVPEKGGPRQDLERALTEFPQHFMDEVVPYVSKRYRLLGDRKHQAVAGLSNGAAHARTIAFQHLDRFGWVGAWSGGGGRPKSVRRDVA